MGLMLPTLAGYPGQHRPLVQAYADQRGLGAASKQWGSTEMAVAPGTIGLGMRLDTVRGRRPLSRVEACCAQQDTARLLGTAVAPAALTDATVGRVRERRDAVGTRKRCTAWAGRAEQGCGVDECARASACAGPLLLGTDSSQMVPSHPCHGCGADRSCLDVSRAPDRQIRAGS